jgi:hypothetical protein
MFDATPIQRAIHIGREARTLDTARAKHREVENVIVFQPQRQRLQLTCAKPTGVQRSHQRARTRAHHHISFQARLGQRL